MRSEEDLANTGHELSDDDQAHIRTLFHEEVEPKLIKLGARLGTLSCGFAGEQFRNWTVRFRSVGNDLEIVEFEYDEDGAELDLDV
ncbi:MAG: hypothetical protein AMK69_01480 [Nitrospira bacterium SG8_3]|nr:MAG: hypothetical protein AMK69_01480 [Nitrospira bacterium SG8_3]